MAYRRSVEWRPLWPYTWVRLAYTKLSLLALDDEFDRALAKAARLGPWRIDVNQPLA
ncbi:MAG: hypothetical protein GWN58_43905, partial [Anaerolineae bacterium]|nr:hypothetical protein [Anaerolineae bacterium]